MNEDQIFESLTRNAFDFLKRGIDEFDRNPKYSVINFCSAVEMLLKARLMKEHWSLIVSKPDQANLAKFVAGDFISVTLEDCRARIRDVAAEDIGDDAYGSFRALANHRNKMVHFFHHGLESDEKAKAQIVAEHCHSWFHLHRLLSRWDAYFSDFRAEIAGADRAMKKHRKYLNAKFKAVKSELDVAQKAGNTPQACSACGFKAAVPKALDAQIASLACLVCDHTEVQVEINCPHCKKSVSITGEGFATCPHKACGKSINPKDLVTALTRDAADPSDYFESKFPANCGSCDGHHTVVERGKWYFCVSCFDISDHIERCDECQEYNTGDMEFSHSTGCGQCEGQWGRMKDN